jgi:hypothetical protein
MSRYFMRAKFSLKIARIRRMKDIVRLFILVVVVTLTTWLIKIFNKNRLARRLGRKVKDSELTSINAWMNAVDAQQVAEENKKG